MIPSTERTGRVYDLVLSQGRGARDRYYEALRRIQITPTPADKEGFLYAPNPVVASRRFVQQITDDLQSFCDARLAETPDGKTLSETMPEPLREIFGGEGVAARIHADLQRAAPFACLDCFPVKTERGIEPAYLEWQTFPTYPATAVFCLEVMEKAFPGIAEAGASFSPEADETLPQLRARVTRMLTRGIEDDPRQGVIVDYRPPEQETAYEFDFSAELSGGPGRGLGIIDPREVIFHEGRPHYRRDGSLIPIRAVFSRLVHGDIADKLLPEASPEERANLSRFFNDADNIHWRVHPLHFLYGTKGDLPRFRKKKLSRFIPACDVVTPEFIAAAARRGITRLEGRVQKPVEGHGGRDIVLDPRLSDLELGAILQDRIEPAATHLTLDGKMTPEMRVMAIPDRIGRLRCSSVFTRVKAPTEFRSNAGAIARKNIPGTGEGYAIIVD